MEDLRDFPRLILVNDVAHLVYNHQLEFSLHLRNRQLFVHAVAACKQELLRDSNIQEALGQALEPGLPIRLCRKKICAPHIFGDSGGIIYFTNNLRWHADSSALNIFDRATLNPVLYYALNRLELLRARSDDVLHERESVHGGSLDHVDDK